MQSNQPITTKSCSKGYIRFFVIIIMSFFLIQQAATYGHIWNSQAHPIKNVEISFDDGTKLVGDIATDWNKQRYILVGKNKTYFSEANVSYMRMAPIQTTNNSFAVNWRFYMPMLSVLAIFLICIVNFHIRPKLLKLEREKS